MKRWVLLICLGCLTTSACSADLSTTQAATSLLSARESTNTPEPTPAPVPTVTPLPGPTPWPTSITPTWTPLPDPTPWPTSITPTWTPIPSKPYFVIGNTPFRFIGAFVPGWFWTPDNFEENAQDLIISAKASGISVFHLMPPGYNCYPETCLEEHLRRLDYFLDVASKHGIYIMFPFVHGWGLSMQPESAYYNPLGTQGLMENGDLAQAFKRRIEFVINRRNTINGRIYRDDPTIMAWLIIEEPFFNVALYPTPPTVTKPQVAAWFDELASYIKSLDPNHLVSIMFTGGMAQFDYENWHTMFDSPSLDFLEFEDGIMNPIQDPDKYQYILDPFTFKLLSLNKPVITMLAPPEISTTQHICPDIEWQTNLLYSFSFLNLNAGAAGIVYHSWMSDLISIPPDEICRVRTDSMTIFRFALLDLANQLNVPGYPSPPLDFVRLSRE